MFTEEDIEKQAKRLEAVFPRLIADIAMLIRRPFKLIWDPSSKTASTDCRAEIRIAPWFFLQDGLEDVGFGTAYHESGHIISSPYGTELLTEAHKKGGETRQHILNLLLDRKDDYATAQMAPGFADTLWARLDYICTMTRREQTNIAPVVDSYRKTIQEKMTEVGQERRLTTDSRARLTTLKRIKKEIDDDPQKWLTKLLTYWKPSDRWEDFFFASKWHKSPRFKETRHAMRLISRRNRLSKASPEEILYLAEKVHEILGEPPKDEKKKGGGGVGNDVLSILMALFGDGSNGAPLDPRLLKKLEAFVGSYLAVSRQNGLQQLVKRLGNMPMMHPGPISVGVKDKVRIIKEKTDPRHRQPYDEIRAKVNHHVQPLVRALRKLDSPSEFTIYGQEEGELDLTAAAQIATGLPGIYKETVLERDIDAEIHLAIDTSGSMHGGKLEIAKQIATLFSEAILSVQPLCDGRIFSYNDTAITDYGPVSRESGFVHVTSGCGNSDTHLLRYAGTLISRSQRKRRLIVLLCDDGPDDLRVASELCQQLIARGVIVVCCLIGVHGAPNIYPIQLLYQSMEGCLQEFGTLIITILRHMR